MNSNELEKFPGVKLSNSGNCWKSRVGQLGESITETYFQEKGFQILERNWRYGKYGELDLIVSSRNTIVAVEVKTRTGSSLGHPLESISMRKLLRIRRLFDIWRLKFSDSYECYEYRIDGIGVLLSPNQKPIIDHRCDLQ